MLASNADTKMVDWVGYQLPPAMVTGTAKTARQWKADPWLPANETLEPDDYDGANAALQVDRGHQAPMANFRDTPHWADTNVMSNITPQKSLLNQQSWRLPEEAERDYVVQTGKHVFVLTAPLYEREMPKLSGTDEEHTIPSGYWRIIAVPIRVTAFIFDQETPGRRPAAGDAAPVRDMEQRAGPDFFWPCRTIWKPGRKAPWMALWYRNCWGNEWTPIVSLQRSTNGNDKVNSTIA